MFQKKPAEKSINTSLFFKEGTVYAVTICPEDRYQYFGSPNRMQKFRNTLREILFHYHEAGIQYHHLIELSEPKSKSEHGPRLHTHGIMLLPTKQSVKVFLLSLYNMLCKIGIIDLDVVEDEAVWRGYCHKQQGIIDEVPLHNQSWENIFKNQKVKPKLPKEDAAHLKKTKKQEIKEQQHTWFKAVENE